MFRIHRNFNEHVILLYVYGIIHVAVLYTNQFDINALAINQHPN